MTSLSLNIYLNGIGNSPSLFSVAIFSTLNNYPFSLEQSIVAQQLLTSTLSNNVVTFTGLNIPLQPNSVYWVALTANTGSYVTWNSANSDVDAVIPATDYNLIMRDTSGGTTYTFTGGVYYRMSINAD
jgi:hypothetical protein